MSDFYIKKIIKIKKKMLKESLYQGVQSTVNGTGVNAGAFVSRLLQD